MPKTKISEYSLTAANNTDINSIDIAEGCAPSGINNAIRELMKQVKDFQGGTSGDLLAIAAGGTNAATTTAALQNLGGTTTGINLFKAVSSSVARTELGATTVGNDVFTAASTSAARTAIGASTLGGNVFTITNPSAITFPRFNADNTVSALSAADFRTAIGAGVGGGDVTTTGTQTLTNKTLTDPAIIGTILEDIFTITDGAAFEIDPGNGSIQLITLGASRTPKATNFTNGESVILMVDDGTARTITWTDSTFGTGGVSWKTNGGVAPTLNTTGYTVIVLWEVAGQIYGARVGDA